MLKPSLMESLAELPAPVLTLYLDTNRAESVHRGPEPAYLTRLESQAKLTEQTLYQEKREAFREQVGRVEVYLRTHPPQSKAVLIFAGRDTWEFVPLEIDVEDEVQWGRPAIAQLLWLLDEYKPYGIVVVGRKRALFFLYSLGEIVELEAKEFVLEPSKEKEMGPASRAFGVRVSRGTNRDVYKHHLDAEYAHYYRQIAADVERWCAAENFQSILLIGLVEALESIRKELSQPVRKKVASVAEDLVWVSRNRLRKRMEPIVFRHKRDGELALVNTLLGEDSSGLVVGIDETLVRLQQGKIRNLVVVKGLDAPLKRCGECLWVDRTADPVCPACGRERYSVSLRNILPELVRRHNASVQVVSAPAADKLKRAGGIGGWLRDFERKEYSACA